LERELKVVQDGAGRGWRRGWHELEEGLAGAVGGAG